MNNAIGAVLTILVCVLVMGFATMGFHKRFFEAGTVTKKCKVFDKANDCIKYNYFINDKRVYFEK